MGSVCGSGRGIAGQGGELAATRHPPDCFLTLVCALWRRVCAGASFPRLVLSGWALLLRLSLLFLG